MRTKRKTTGRRVSKTKRYARRTASSRLSSIARKWQRKFAALAKRTTGRTTMAQKRKAIKQEITKVAKYLRQKTLAKIDTRLSTLKTQIARRLKVAVNSSKVTSSAIKRLNAKRRQISNCKTAKKLVALCKNFKVSSYKNPAKKSAGKKHSAVYKKRKTTKSKVSSGIKKQTATLKKEITSLKRRNSFMKKQVAKFRKEVAKLQAHYGTLNTKSPRWKVIESKKVHKEVSNIVNFATALNNAVKQQRKAG